MFKINVWYKYSTKPFVLRRQTRDEAIVAADEAAIEANVVGITVEDKQGRIVYAVNDVDVILADPKVRKLTATGGVEIEADEEVFA